MPPDERELGELIKGMTALEESVKEVKDSVVELRRENADMRKENADDHSKVVEALGKLASKEEMTELGTRTDKLESFVDNWKGRLAVLAGAVGVLTTIAVGFLLKITGGA